MKNRIPTLCTALLMTLASAPVMTASVAAIVSALSVPSIATAASLRVQFAGDKPQACDIQFKYVDGTTGQNTFVCNMSTYNVTSGDYFICVGASGTIDHVQDLQSSLSVKVTNLDTCESQEGGFGIKSIQLVDEDNYLHGLTKWMSNVLLAAEYMDLCLGNRDGVYSVYKNLRLAKRDGFSCQTITMQTARRDGGVSTGWSDYNNVDKVKIVDETGDDFRFCGQFDGQEVSFWDFDDFTGNIYAENDEVRVGDGTFGSGRFSVVCAADGDTFTLRTSEGRYLSSENAPYTGGIGQRNYPYANNGGSWGGVYASAGRFAIGTRPGSNGGGIYTDGDFASLSDDIEDLQFWTVKGHEPTDHTTKFCDEWAGHYIRLLHDGGKFTAVDDTLVTTPTGSLSSNLLVECSPSYTDQPAAYSGMSVRLITFDGRSVSAQYTNENEIQLKDADGAREHWMVEVKRGSPNEYLFKNHGIGRYLHGSMDETAMTTGRRTYLDSNYFSIVDKGVAP